MAHLDEPERTTVDSRRFMAADTYPDPTLEWETEQLQSAATFHASNAEIDYKSLLISDRLKSIGDRLQQQYSEEYLSGIITPFVVGSFQTCCVSRIISALDALRSFLSVQQVNAYNLIETLSLEAAKLVEALSIYATSE